MQRHQHFESCHCTYDMIFAVQSCAILTHVMNVWQASFFWSGTVRERHTAKVTIPVSGPEGEVSCVLMHVGFPSIRSTFSRFSYTLNESVLVNDVGGSARIGYL